MSFKTGCVLFLAICGIGAGAIALAPGLVGSSISPASAAATMPETAAAAAIGPAPTMREAPAPAPQDPVVAAPAPPTQLVMNVPPLSILPPEPAAKPPARERPATRADVDALAAEMHGALTGTLLTDAPPLTRAALAAAHTMMQRAHTTLDAMQVVLVVDRSPKVQRLWVTVGSPGSNTLEALGSVHVSTGKPGRKEHFRTPVGVFTDDAGILGYRAQGTYNENHIRGIGVRGMRVWDFGWQTTDDWRTPRALMAVRMEMHATDPSVLEPRLGRWDSEGCIRIPTRFNSFLDLSGLIDAKEREAARDDRRFAALLPKHTVPNPLAGQTLVVVDTSEPDAVPSDPVKAHLIAHPDMPGPEHDDAG